MIIVSFNELQVMNIVEEYRSNLSIIENMIVYDDGIIKGVINRKFVGEDVEVCEFYVEPFFNGKGIGRKLIQYVISEAQMAQKKRIFLLTLSRGSGKLEL